MGAAFTVLVMRINCGQGANSWERNRAFTQRLYTHLECDVRLSGTVHVLRLPVQTQILLCLLVFPAELGVCGILLCLFVTIMFGEPGGTVFCFVPPAPRLRT